MQPYRPALRFKQGEYRAAHALQSDMKRYLRPFFIVPPPKEHDPELGRAPTVDEIGHLSGERLGRFWPLAPAYLDTQYVIPALGDEGLKRLFKTARGRNPKLIAVVPICDLLNPLWRELVLSSSPRLAIHLPFEDFDPDALAKGVSSLGISAQDCEIFVDFTGGELDPEIAVEAIAGTLEMAADVAPWGGVIFQASNFPTTNPAEDGKTYEVARHEWTIYERLLRECSIPKDRLGFSDFGADCGKIAFPRSGGGGRPIPHIRYTTTTSTVVVRGLKKGNQSDTMIDVFRRTVDRSDYAGQAFSPADRRIWEASRGLIGPGNASIWREWNMTHHMTRVLRDLGQLAGVAFSDGPVTVEDEQTALL